jgi:amino acid adenylation domain-containing protein
VLAKRKLLSGPELESHLSHWRERLDGAGELELPADRPRGQTYRREQQSLRLSAALTEGVRAWCVGAGATTSMAVAAAFAGLLGRHAGQHDVVFGLTIASGAPGEKDAGFVNTVALRTDLAEPVTFDALLERMKQAFCAAIAHHELSSEQLVDDLRARQRPGRIFQVTFSAEPSVDAAAKLDLTLSAIEAAGSLELELAYNADLFEEARVVDLLKQLEQLLGAAVANAQGQLAHASLVTSSARSLLPDSSAALVARWEGSIAERVSANAARTPSALAAEDPVGRWTYRELEASSNQLAHWLVGQGIARGEVVGVYAHRSASLAATLLGVLKAGAAFAIFDPSYPAHRIIDALALAKPRAWIVVSGAEAPAAELESKLGLLDLRARGTMPRRPADAAPWSGAPTTPLALVIDPDDLAYLTFTSGSTGKPKAIVGTHRPLSHFFAWDTQTFGLRADDRFSLLSGLAHDPLLRDVFTPLWIGASLHAPPPDAVGVPGALAAWLTATKVTVVHTTPPLARVILTGAGALPSLRFVFFGGDVLTRSLVRAVREAAPKATVVNFYGATETPQAMASFVVPTFSAATEDGGFPISVGVGIEGVQLLVRNGLGEGAGIGELGEIVVRTPYLTRGYLNPAPADAARFSDGAFRTGDFGRYLSTGDVVYVGRVDDQVKVRGFRVELGEIESALRAHPQVREAVAVASDDEASGGKRLIAYVAGDADSAALRTHLRERLPDYMIPGIIVRIERMPLTPNGKVDRRALPTQTAVKDAGAATKASPPSAPVNDVAAKISAIWKDTLGVDAVDPHDNFFDLGGHSLNATQIAFLICEAFDISITVRSIFDGPTVAELSERVLEAILKSAAPEPVASARPESGPMSKRGSRVAKGGAPSSRKGLLPLSFEQETFWSWEHAHPGTIEWNEPEGFKLHGKLDVPALERTIAELIRRHEPLRTIFPVVEGKPRQRVLERGEPLRIVDLRTLAGDAKTQEVDRIRKEECGHIFEPERRALFRCCLVRLAGDEHLLFMVAHHLVLSDRGRGAVNAEFGPLYEAFSKRLPSPLPEPTVQYADYAVRQKERFDAGELADHMHYWRSKLEGASATVLPGKLPANTPRPSSSGACSFHPVSIAKPVADAAEALARSEQGLLVMVLLAALKVLLHQRTGQENLVVSAVRADPSEAAVGDPSDYTVVRTDVSGSPSFRLLVSRVRTNMMEAWEHELPLRLVLDSEIPFEHALHNVNINFQRATESTAPTTFGGVSVEPLWVWARSIRWAQLALVILVKKDTVEGMFLTSDDVFGREEAAKLSSDYSALLKHLVEHPDEPIRNTTAS